MALLVSTRPRAKPVKTKTVSLRQAAVPVYYEQDEEARTIASKIFMCLDADGSGYLCQKELEEAETKMLAWTDRVTAVSDMIEGMSSTADQDGDSMVDDEEWHRFFRTLYEMLGRKQFLSLARQWASNMGGRGNTSRDAEPAPSAKRIKNVAAGAREAPVTTGPDSLHESPAAGHTAGIASQAADEQDDFLAKMFARSAGKASNDAKQKVHLESRKTESFALRAVTTDSDLLEDVPEETPAARTTDDIPDNLKDAAADAAAIEIQKVFRGKRGRISANEEKNRKTNRGAGKAALLAESKIVRVEQKNASFSELWDLLTVSGGRIITKLAADDVASLFLECKLTGLNLELASTVPMHLSGNCVPEDVSTGEISHLCTLLIESKDITYEEAQKELQIVKGSCREMGDKIGIHAARGAEVGMRQFRRLLEFLSSMMCVDMDYIISQMVWLKTQSFQMTETMAALVMERAARKAEDEMDLVRHPDLSILDSCFTLNHLMNLAYHGGIIDPQGVTGVVGTDLQLFYKRVHKQMPELLQKHAERRKQKVAALKKRDESSLLGRTETEVLIGELFKEAPLSKLFASPLQMTVRLLRIHD